MLYTSQAEKMYSSSKTRAQQFSIMAYNVDSVPRNWAAIMRVKRNINVRKDRGLLKSQDTETWQEGPYIDTRL